MIQVLGVVISVGLVDSLNPSTIGPALYLASASHGRKQVLKFTLGAGGVYVLAGVVLVLGPGNLLLSLIPHPKPHVRYIVEIVVGAGLAVGGAVVWRRRAKMAERKLPGIGSRRRSPVVLGASIMAVELPTAFPYFAAIAAIVGSNLNAFEELILITTFNLAFVLPLLAIAGALSVGGGRAHRLLATGRELLQRRWPQVLGVALVVIGAFVVMLGTTGLIGSGHGKLARGSRSLHRALKP